MKTPRLITTLILLLLFINTNLLANDQAKTFIFLIHGIGSNTQTTFSHMGEALKNVLPKYEDRQVITNEFNYRTGDDQLSTLDFAYDFNQFMEQKLVESGFNEAQDKISIIAHSQGGLVSLLWIHQSFHRAYATNYHQQLDSFITLGTPFWGTSIVLFPLLISPIAKHFGDQESREMLWGSKTIDLLEEATSDKNPSFKAFLRQINVINIGGNALVYPNVASWYRSMDDDIAVPLPSSNINHFTAYDEQEHYKPNQLIDVASKQELGQFFVAQALHTLPFTKGKFKVTQALPQVPKQCMTDEFCQHISYPYVWRGLLKKPLMQLDAKIKKKSTSYTIDLELKIDHESMKPEEFEFNFYDQNGVNLKSLGYKLNTIYSRESEQYYQHTANKDHLRFIFGGRAMNLDQKKIVIEIKHKGNRFISKRVATYIQAQHTSFVKSKMIRFNDYLADLK